MLFSFGLLFLLGIIFGRLFKLLKFPELIGMIIAGILIGPYVLDLLDDNLLQISEELRRFALVIILIRAGLNLKLSDLKQIGRPAILLCFIPATLEIVGTVILAPRILGVSILDSMIIASVLAAVSPAVIVPFMIKLMEKGYGTNKKIPHLIMAGSAVDDVYVIVLFTTFMGVATHGVVNKINFLKVPTSIIFGVIVGFAMGVVLHWIFKRVIKSTDIKVLVMLSVSFIMMYLESLVNLNDGFIGFSGIVAVIVMGIMIKSKDENLSEKLGAKFANLWSGASIILFVLVGASVNIDYAFNSLSATILLIVLVLVFRVAGVLISLINTNLNKKEKLFCAISSVPKATVQAAIGGVPLSMGLGCGEIVLTVAVISILFTAPIGAFAIENTYKKLLS